MDMDSTDIADITRVAEAWASPDDWNVPVIQVSTLGKLLDALSMGDSPNRLIAHAQHVRSECERMNCITLWFEQEYGR